MGFQDRDYARPASTSFAFVGRSDGSSFIFKLIAIHVVIFLGQILWKAPPDRELAVQWAMGRIGDVSPEERALLKEQLGQEFDRQLAAGRIPRESVLTNWLILDTELVLLHGQVWRVFTYVFLHDQRPNGHWHIIMNMWILFLVGRELVDRYGAREFLLFYLAGGVLAGMASMGFDLLMQDYSRCLGASGAVSAALVLYACLWPRTTWLLFFVIPMPVYVLVLIAALLDLIPLLQRLSGQPAMDNIGHAAHLGGMAFGYAYFRRGWSLSPLWQRLTCWFGKGSQINTTLKARARGLRIVHPENEPFPVDFEARVDELLQKVHDHGEASLTQAEREFLIEASRRKRRRDQSG